MDHKIDFDAIAWQSPAPGFRYKAFVHGSQRIRLVEFSEGLVEPDWCYKGHAGYVLEGELTTDFDGHIERHKAGDVIFIPAGEDDRHKAFMGKGGRALLLLFEMI